METCSDMLAVEGERRQQEKKRMLVALPLLGNHIQRGIKVKSLLEVM